MNSQGSKRASIEEATLPLQGGLSVRRTAEQYNVPKSILSDQLTGKVEFGAHSGPSRFLSDDEEEFAKFLCQSAQMGYAETKKEVVAIVEAIIASKGNAIHVYNGWWEGFRKRHPFLTLRTVEKLSFACSVAQLYLESILTC